MCPRNASTSQGTSRIASKHQKLEEIRKEPPLEKSEGVWPCQHLGFKLLASRLRHDICCQPPCFGTSLWQPRGSHKQPEPTETLKSGAEHRVLKMSPSPSAHPAAGYGGALGAGGLLGAVISTPSGWQQTRAGTANVGCGCTESWRSQQGGSLKKGTGETGRGAEGGREAARVGNSSSTGKGANSLVKPTEARGVSRADRLLAFRAGAHAQQGVWTVPAMSGDRTTETRPGEVICNLEGPLWRM